MPGQEICRGEEKTLESLCVGSHVANKIRRLCRGEKFIGGHQILGFQIVGNVKNSLAFANCKRVFVDVAIGNLPENVVTTDGMVEEIFTGLQATPGMTARVYLKCKGAADHARLLQQ